MSPKSFALFDTTIGTCGLVWGEGGLLGVFLPETTSERTRARIGRRFPDAAQAAPPDEARRAIEAMTALLDGEARDLRGLRLDLSGHPPFFRQVWEAARAVPPGGTITYGELARRLGEPGAARAVGEAMGKNPFPIIVPCHRVLAAGGRMGGFSAPGGTRTKLRMLEIEGALRPETLPLFGG